MGHVLAVASTVRAAIVDAAVDAVADIHSVLVGTPSVSFEDVRAVQQAGRTVVSGDMSSGLLGALAYAVDAAALGVGIAVGEVDERAVAEGTIHSDWQIRSSLAWVTAGASGSTAEVVVLGNSRRSASSLAIGHGLMMDALDQEGVKAALRSAGLRFECCPDVADQKRIVMTIAKLSLPIDGRVRTELTTLREAADGPRVIKAVAGALVGGVVGTGRILASGGQPSQQGPMGGGPVATIVEVG
jgi:cyanuric acid amidohydrolase